MAIYINNITPFDATDDYALSFVYNGGNQAYYNKATIKDNDTNITVYENTVTTMRSVHIIPADTLINGKVYNVTVTVYDMNQIEQAVSRATVFKCLSAPRVYIDNLDDVVHESTVTVNLRYEQDEGEKLQCYNVSLYSYNKNLIYTTDTTYNVSNTNVLITGLEDKSSYYLKAKILTVNGLSAETDYVGFICNYNSSTDIFSLTLENIKDQGGILIGCNIKVVTGITDITPIFYNDSYIDLREGHYILDNVYSLGDPFTLIGVAHDFVQNDVICQMTDINGVDIIIKYKEGAYESTGGVAKAFLELVIDDPIARGVVYSNYIDVPTRLTDIAYCVQRKDNLYEVKVKTIGESTDTESEPREVIV